MGEGFTLEAISGVRCPMERMSAVVSSMVRHSARGIEETHNSFVPDVLSRKPPQRAVEAEPLLTAEDVAKRLNVSTDWVWDHSSRKRPYLPVIRMSDGVLRYRPSEVEEFVNERERASVLRRKR